MKAYGNQIKRPGAKVVVFTNETPRAGSEFEIVDTHEKAINIAKVTECKPATMGPTKNEVHATIIA
jgi:hypothetical protein